MERTPEPELMEGLEQAEAYARADFREVNQRFVDQLLERFPTLDSGRVVDLGTGPGDIPIRLARARPNLHIVAVDGSRAMLEHARRCVADAHLARQIELVEGVLPGCLPAEHRFDVVLSNSLLHHLHHPEQLWAEVKALARANAAVFIVDLMRPASREAARQIVERYSADERPVLKTDFYNSLLAAFTVEEVRAQLDRAGLGCLRVEPTSDRHLLIAGRMP